MKRFEEYNDDDDDNDEPPGSDLQIGEFHNPRGSRQRFEEELKRS
jgi:hypothetical protein